MGKPQVRFDEGTAPVGASYSTRTVDAHRQVVEPQINRQGRLLRHLLRRFAGFIDELHGEEPRTFYGDDSHFFDGLVPQSCRKGHLDAFPVRMRPGECMRQGNLQVPILNDHSIRREKEWKIAVFLQVVRNFHIMGIGIHPASLS